MKEKQLTTETDGFPTTMPLSPTLASGRPGPEIVSIDINSKQNVMMKLHPEKKKSFKLMSMISSELGTAKDHPGAFTQAVTSKMERDRRFD